jgi:hypothetical protein
MITVTPEQRRTVVAVLVLLGLALIIWLAGWSLFVSLTCDRDLKSVQTVDPNPLLEVTLPPDMNDLTDEIDLGVFHSYRIIRLDGRDVTGRYEYPKSNGNSDYSYIDVELTLFESIDGAMDGFATDCEDRSFINDLSDFEQGVTENGQFFVSYTREARAGPEGLCRPLGYYNSFVVIRNQNLLSWIDEQTSDAASTRKNAVIQQLANELSD